MQAGSSLSEKEERILTITIDFMRTAYNLGISLYSGLIGIASCFSNKAKKWKEGRKDIFPKLEAALKDQKNVVWFHCASLGEFEQGRPLMEAYKNKYREDKILLTFFSPSGYEIRKNTTLADYVFYLPTDTESNAKKFLELVNPKSIFFIKYEFWFNYLQQIKLKNIPCYLVSGIFRPDQLFFKFYAQWFFKHLKCFKHFFLQDSRSADILKTKGLSNYSICGDTRFDRVMQIVSNVKELPEIQSFCASNFTLISGSSWEKEDELLAKLVNEGIFKGKVIIAPHELSENKSVKLMNTFQGKAVLWSQRKNSDIQTKQVMIIDTIGLLSSIYQYGSLALIGGGFGKGVHNVLEAATFGIPILLGPNHEKFKEVNDLVALKAATVIHEQKDFNKCVDQLFEHNEMRERKGQIAKKYVFEHAGATDCILTYLAH